MSNPLISLAQKQTAALFFALKPKPQSEPAPLNKPRRVHEKHVKFVEPHELPLEELERLRALWGMCFLPVEGEEEGKACWPWQGLEKNGPWLSRGVGEEKRVLHDGLYQVEGPIRNKYVKTLSLTIHFAERKPLPPGWEWQLSCGYLCCCNPAHLVARTHWQMKEAKKEKIQESKVAQEEVRAAKAALPPKAKPVDPIETWLGRGEEKGLPTRANNGIMESSHNPPNHSQ